MFEVIDSLLKLLTPDPKMHGIRLEKKQLRLELKKLRVAKRTFKEIKKEFEKDGLNNNEKDILEELEKAIKSRQIALIK